MDMHFRVEHTHVLCCLKILMYSCFYGGPEQPNMFKYEHYKSLILLSTHRRFGALKKKLFQIPVLIYISYSYNVAPLECGRVCGCR